MINRILLVAASLALVVGCETPPPRNTQASVPVQTTVRPVTTPSVQNQGQARPMTMAPGPGEAYQGPAPGTINDFRVSVGERVYFDLNEHILSADDRETLQRQAAWLQSYPNVTILVAGNCDERGTRDYNLALGERRAATVRNYLVSVGVDPTRVQTVSYGKERPVAIGTSPDTHAMNRNGFTQIMTGAVG